MFPDVWIPENPLFLVSAEAVITAFLLLLPMSGLCRWRRRLVDAHDDQTPIGKDKDKDNNFNNVNNVYNPYNYNCKKNERKKNLFPAEAAATS